MTRRDRQFLGLLLAAYLGLGALYMLATPPFEASDEIHHYPVVRNIAMGQGLPVQQLGVETAWAQEGSQPPAYYLAAAGLTFWIDTSDFPKVHVANPFARTGIPGTPQNANQTRAPAELLAMHGMPAGTFLAVYVVRCLSLLLGGGTVACAYMLARTFFDETWRPMLTAALVAFNPMFLFISASVNNDNLVWFEASLILVLCARMALGPRSASESEVGTRVWQVPAVGLLLGLAALTKISGLLLWPTVGLALGLQAWRTGKWQACFRSGIVVLVTGSLLAGWWYARNYMLYGELLGIQRMAAIAGLRPASFTIAQLFGEWRGFVESYFGVFGAFSILAPPDTYAWYLALTVLAVVGVVLTAVRKRGLLSWRFAAYGVLAFFIVITGTGVVRWTLMTMASQGRLMFTALAPLSLGMALGIGACVPRRFHRLLTVVTVVVSGWMAVRAAVLGIIPAYLPASPVLETALPASLQRLDVVPAPGVKLLGYALDPSASYLPADKLTVTLYWQATDTIAADYGLFLHILARGTTLAGSVDSWPGGGLRPTSFWQSGNIYVDQYEIQLLDGQTLKDVIPSTLQLGVGMWPDDPNHTFPVLSADGRTLPSVSVLAGRLVSGAAAVLPPEAGTAAQFENGISLALGPQHMSGTAGVPWHLPLWWRADTIIGQNFTVFVHAIDEAGQIQAQADSPPVDGYWPTSVWRAADWVVDSHDLTFATAGQFRVRVGLYDPESGLRLSAWRPTGETWNNGEVDVGEVTVK